jgi:autotransporter family porin
VRPTAENRPGNTAANHFTPPFVVTVLDGADSQAFASRIDGAFQGTTDEILQWSACKWGIDEDLNRAIAVTESTWYQSTLGDGGASVGIQQVNQGYHHCLPGCQQSTAYNADWARAWWRTCFEGNMSWLGATRGDANGCVGAWYSGAWKDAGANSYISEVLGHVANKPWLKSGF